MPGFRSGEIYYDTDCSRLAAYRDKQEMSSSPRMNYPPAHPCVLFSEPSAKRIAGKTELRKRRLIFFPPLD
jgi:hypothetical protein